jgi:hypothetical protein
MKRVKFVGLDVHAETMAVAVTVAPRRQFPIERYRVSQSCRRLPFRSNLPVACTH